MLGHVRWAREVRVTPFMHWLDHGIQFDYPAIDGTEAGWGRFYGANVSIKRELAERVGGFDEVRLPYGYEDLDFGYRADALGLRLLYNRRRGRRAPARVRPAVLQAAGAPAGRRRARFVAQAPRARAVVLPHVQPRGAACRRASRPRPPPDPLRPRARPRWSAPRAWRSADLYYRQELAPDFLAAWEEVARPAGAVADLGELDRPAGGPK